LDFLRVHHFYYLGPSYQITGRSMIFSFFNKYPLNGRQEKKVSDQ